MWVVGAVRAMIAAPDLTWMADPNRVRATGLADGFGFPAARLCVAAGQQGLEGQKAPGRSLFFLS